MYKENLALNNPQWLICHKTQPNQTVFHFEEKVNKYHPFAVLQIDVINDGNHDPLVSLLACRVLVQDVMALLSPCV